MAYPILTENTSGLLPVQRTIACKERRYDFCLTVYFFMMASCKVSTVAVYEGGKTAGKIRGNQEYIFRGKSSIWLDGQ